MGNIKDVKEQCVFAAKNKGRPRAFNCDRALFKALDIFWRKGYELTSVAELCAAMEINPPSLYSAFGNKENLFIRAIEYYEQTYWKTLWDTFIEEKSVYTAIENLFNSAVKILLSPGMPCGCMVVLSAINVSPESTQAFKVAQDYRQYGKSLFIRRLQRGVADGELPAQTDIHMLSTMMYTLLEGLSIQVIDGVTSEELASIGQTVVRLLPEKRT